MADDQLGIGVATAPRSSGFSDTLKFIVYAGAAAVLLYVAAQFSSSDSQYIRIGFWVASLISMLLASGQFLATLKDYNLNFLTLSSTWTMLLVAGACVLLMFSMGGRSVEAPLQTFDVIIIAGILLFTGLSLISNISKTNFIFGFLLTLVQLLFSALLILVAVMAWDSRHRNR